MKLYLVQHGLARSGDQDPERRLSDRGVYESEKSAACLASMDIRVEKIFHSAKVRAEETARIFDRTLKTPGGALRQDGLNPKDDPTIWADRLQDEESDIMLVGHLPQLARLASLLLCVDSGREIIRFKNSGVLCLERGDGGPWTVNWMLVPALLGKE